MKLNRIGTTDLMLSAVGFGTAQLRMVPERQAVDTLLRGFELGVNWVHTAPDYGGAEEIVLQAFRRSGRKDLVMGTVGYGGPQKIEELFEHTCEMVGSDRLDLYGIACIDDREFVKENVWEPGGMVEFLRKKKEAGRIRALFCTTHAPPDRVAHLIECGVFDAIMLAYNPLGFHVLSYHALSEGKQYEELEENRRRIFPLALERQVSLLVMKPFAGGMLCESKAFPPRHRFTSEAERLEPGDILRAILRLPGVTAVCPGTASVEEAEQNALAGREPLDMSVAAAAHVERVAEGMRAELCSRCGECESTCSKNLQISWMMREAYMWSYPGDSFDTIDRHHYLARHPSLALTCVTCTERTCECPSGLEIPDMLERAHRQVLNYRAEGSMHATPEERANKGFSAHVKGQIVVAEIPRNLAPLRAATGRVWLENHGTRRWSPTTSDSIHDLVSLRASIARIGNVDVPLRHMVEPGERTHFVFEIPPIERPGTYDVSLDLVSPGGMAIDAQRTHVLSMQMTVGSGPAALPSLGGEVRTRESYGARYLEWSVPREIPPGACRTIRVVIENNGTMTWRRHAPLGNRIAVGLFCDGHLIATLELPVDTVPPGSNVTFYHRLAAPEEPGPHVLRFELVELELTRFTDRGVPPLDVGFSVEPGPADVETKLWKTAARVNPWHYYPTAGVGQSVDGAAFPVFAARAEGCRIFDTSGRAFIDYTMGWGTTVLGYAHPHVQAALATAMKSAPLLAYVQPIEMEVSQMLVEEFPGAEIVVFGKNGSDVCTLAARLARGHTGRSTILYCGYHGWGDFWAEQHGFARTGIPGRPHLLIHKFPFNDVAAFLALFERHKRDLACVMLEPSGPWGGNEVGHEPDADQVFLETLRRKTKEVGALLVFDEIITGFRYPQNSVQKARGVVPDLTCLGKALASGMPLSALLGPDAILRPGFPRCHYGPTFRAEAFSFHAAKATIEVIRREPVTQFVWDYGTRLRAGIEDALRHAGVPGCVKGPPFRMSLYIDERVPATKLRMRTLLQQELLRAGISIFNNGVMLPSYAHDQNALQSTLEAMARAAGVVARATRDGNLDRHIEIPLLAEM